MAGSSSGPTASSIRSPAALIRFHSGRWSTMIALKSQNVKIRDRRILKKLALSVARKSGWNGSRIKTSGSGHLWMLGVEVDPNDGIFAQRFASMVEGFALFNPHATFRLHWFDQPVTEWKATTPAWEKWLPCKPTSAHWYEVRHLERLIGAYITHDRDTGADRLASDLIAEFDGLTGSQKRSKVLEDADLLRVKLSEFVAGDRLDTRRIQKLLSAMQKHTRPVNPRGWASSVKITCAGVCWRWGSSRRHFTTPASSRKTVCLGSWNRHSVTAAQVGTSAGKSIPARIGARRSKIRSAVSDQPAKAWKLSSPNFERVAMNRSSSFCTSRTRALNTPTAARARSC